MISFSVLHDISDYTGSQLLTKRIVTLEPRPHITCKNCPGLPSVFPPTHCPCAQLHMEEENLLDSCTLTYNWCITPSGYLACTTMQPKVGCRDTTRMVGRYGLPALSNKCCTAPTRGIVACRHSWVMVGIETECLLRFTGQF